MYNRRLYARCMTCTQSANFDALNKLKRMRQELNPYGVYSVKTPESLAIAREIEMSLMRGVVSDRCKNGLGRCDALARTRRESEYIIREISIQIANLIILGNIDVIHRIIQLCRGTFPDTCRKLQRYVNKNIK